MQKPLIFFLLVWSYLSTSAQTTATFEEFNLPAGSYLNGADGSGGFASGHVFLPNDYNATYDAWSGWAVSAVTDNQTPGFSNQYGVISGGGFDGSAVYAVAYAAAGAVLKLEAAAAGGVVEGLYLNNSAYAYYSMRDGDPFAKRFGGETGDDPDFLLLTVKKYLNGEIGVDSVDFYLADYRFKDSSQDYLVKDWTYLDLSVLGAADSLLFTLRSSDVGQYGMNTPAYFCVDHITTADMATSVSAPAPVLDYRVFPNPTADLLLIDWQEPEAATLTLFDVWGRPCQSKKVGPGRNEMDLRSLPVGLYFLQRTDRPARTVKRVLKR